MSSNTSCLEPHPGFYRLLMKGIFDAYVPFGKKLIFELVTDVRTRDSMVFVFWISLVVFTLSSVEFFSGVKKNTL